MARIAKLELNQLNLQLDRIEELHKRLAAVENRIAKHSFIIAATDPLHAPQTTNNIVFTWTGGTTTLSWTAGWIKDKNWNAQSLGTPAISSAPGVQHIWSIPAGSLTLTASTFYWLGWDPDKNTMRAEKDVSNLHGDRDIQIICQLFTGTGAQTGTAGGGGSSNANGSDLSGTRYKLF